MKILVTAGPTREPIDPVRFISNRSSGKMGYSIAAAARQKGHSVILVSGPVAIKPPAGIKLLKVMTARDMLSAVKENVQKCDALVMAAAVSDWRPAVYCRQKLKKTRMPEFIRLKPNPDILMSLARQKGTKIFVGFAAETNDLKAEPLRKLRQKRLDLIVANNVIKSGSGFESDTNRVTFYFAGGEQEELPLMTKEKIARRIVEWIEQKELCRVMSSV